jgi:hypothetical protein
MRQSKIVLLLLSFLGVSLSSCLKEHIQNIDADKSIDLIEFANTGSNVAGASSTYPGFFIDLGTLAPGETAKFNINIGYSGVHEAPADITVNLEMDQAALDQYNEENGTEYVLPPADVFQLPTSVVINKGMRLGQAEVSITRSANFEFEESYALPLKISSVSQGKTSSNFSKAVYAFGIRNIYDGVYTVTGTLSDAVAASITGNYPFTAELTTLGPNSIYFDPHPILSGGAQSSYGEFAPVFTIDPATNKITSVVNAYGQPSPDRGRAAEIIATGVNNYDPTTKSFDVSYALFQGGALRTTFVEHFEYVGPR